MYLLAFLTSACVHHHLLYCTCSVMYLCNNFPIVTPYKQWTKCPQYKPASYHLVYHLLRCYQSKTERAFFLATILAPFLTFALMPNL